ncbi:transketolase [Paenarthrobacter sp. CC6]|uniref:transketolase n=1 Tax=Paenarthrobacter sp. CC6 TaxID=3029184 RepID=UPI00339C3EE2
MTLALPLSIQDLTVKADQIRVSILDMLARAKSGHSAGPLGMAEILAVLYFNVLRHDPERPEWGDRDVFYLSNGHTAPVLYAALAHSGYFPVEELQTLRQFGSRLQGHPEREKLPGLESTSGPLGSGLSQAAGHAYAVQHIDKQLDRFVYVAMGDGELNEGNIWEAAMFAGKYKLGKLIGIVDRNYIQIDGQTEDVMPLDNLRAKWEAFGWHVLEVDGNNVASLLDAINTGKAVAQKPTVILAYTVPGKGVPFMEYDHKWHGKPPTAEQAREAITFINATGKAAK